MTNERDEKIVEESAKSPPAPADRATVTRRNLLRAGLTLGLVFVAGGVASVAKSLFSPANPPSPEAVQTSTPTVTKVSTVTSTVTVGSQLGAGNQTASASTSQVSSQSTTTSSTSTTSSPFPQFMVANVSDLVVGTPLEFNYPLEETPNILVKLGVKATGGVGPDGDIVAFSQVCQHLGCIFAYVAPNTSPACDDSFKSPTPTGYCCCHGSTYDLTAAGAVTGGPAPRPAPQVTLMVDSSGDIYAIGMGPPTIFGHDTGTNNILDDLQGGTLVSGT